MSNLDSPGVGAEHIVSIIERSSLSDSIRMRAISIIRKNSEGLDDLFIGLHYKPPQALPEFAGEFARYSLNLVTPLFTEHWVPLPVGRDIYDKIYQSICGEK